MTITTGAPAGSALGTRDDYADAIGTAIRAAAAYYGSGDSPLDDASFDLLVSLIQAYEDRYPEQIDPATPTGEVAHTAAMLSPANAFGPQDLLDWEASVVRRLGAPVRGGFVVEPKLDGASKCVRYRNSAYMASHRRRTQPGPPGRGAAGGVHEVVSRASPQAP
ncbi:hypothetical protein OHB36_35300 [Streptomyces sp. NBC_00320]|uniref:hypothetical protein n=1 Tax=Streptomyces sp. NBC_00320 TaxID=2975711 RepID=UPI002257999B|nr:hypothetical protein [Streptomyces sp. NBC_00320]MCX5151958.1 hypothetical protein [Streptomyces sp. NBC_00320]